MEPEGMKDLQNGTLDGSHLANNRRKSDRGLCTFKRETTTMAGCLVVIPGSLRANPYTGFQYWSFRLLGLNQKLKYDFAVL